MEQRRHSTVHRHKAAPERHRSTGYKSQVDQRCKEKIEGEALRRVDHGNQRVKTEKDHGNHAKLRDKNPGQWVVSRGTGNGSSSVRRVQHKERRSVPERGKAPPAGSGHLLVRCDGEADDHGETGTQT